MADNEDLKDGPETPASSPGSTTVAPNETKAPKDRSCPFCGQAFTSSSLGRHLDLYIKPKNPKPPDGVHDVNEIKKIRGGITRRQPRTSVKLDSTSKSERAKSTGDWAPSTASKRRRGNELRAPDDSAIKSPRDVDDGRVRTWLNAANWQATGVINDLPARAPSRASNGTPSAQAQRLEEMRRDNLGNRVQRPSDYVTLDIAKLQETAETGRAAEMALREVLGSLEAAKKKAEPQKLFDDFDFCSLAFPGLCLAMLSPPSTLFTSTPFTIAHTWSLTPPGETQNATLIRVLRERVAALRDGAPENVPESLVFKHRVHLDSAYEHWQTLSEEEKATTWHLEICRAFVQEQRKKRQLKDDLELAEQRIRHLEADYDRLSRFQLPREYLLHPPSTLPVSSTMMRNMKSTDVRSGAWEADYDADALLNKWRTEVKAVTRPLKPSPAQPQYVETSRSQMKTDIFLNGSVFGVNGAMPRDADSLPRMHQPREAGPDPPRNLGGIIGADEDEVEEVQAFHHHDGAGGYSSPRTFGEDRNRGALTRLRSARQNEFPFDGTLNANGKRPLRASSASGRSPGPRVYKEEVS